MSFQARISSHCQTHRIIRLSTGWYADTDESVSFRILTSALIVAVMEATLILGSDFLKENGVISDTFRRIATFTKITPEQCCR